MNRQEAHQRSTEALQELATALQAGKSETLVQYLSTMARFHRYSFGNCLLIAVQCPQATHVAGFHRWKQLGRQVKKGERGIAILAPLVRRPKPEDDDSEDAKTAAARSFRVVHVFDVSQTEGADLPEFATVAGEPGQKLSRLEQFVREQGITLRYDDDLPGGAEGVSYRGEIVIVPGLSAAKTFSVLAHELAHELLHDAQRRKEASKTVLETEAEAVAFVVSRACGLEGTTHSSDYIQLYAGDQDALLESLDRIQRTACRLIEALETECQPQEVQHDA